MLRYWLYEVYKGVGWMLISALLTLSIVHRYMMRTEQETCRVLYGSAVDAVMEQYGVSHAFDGLIKHRRWLDAYVKTNPAMPPPPSLVRAWKVCGIVVPEPRE